LEDAGNLCRIRTINARIGDETSDEIVHVPLARPALSAD
jgi:hypothetical protein